MTVTRGEGRFASVSAALLLGGESSRMGRDKAALEVGGIPCALRVGRLLAALCEEVLLVGGAAPPGLAGRVVADPAGPGCALRGLTAALEAATQERVLVVATDLPLLEVDLLLALLAWPEADAVVPRTADGIHPLCALYHRSRVLPLARERLARGELKLQGLLDSVETAYIAPEEIEKLDPDGRMLANLNTPEDLACVEAWLAQR